METVPRPNAPSPSCRLVTRGGNLEEVPLPPGTGPAKNRPSGNKTSATAVAFLRSHRHCESPTSRPRRENSSVLQSIPIEANEKRSYWTDSLAWHEKRPVDTKWTVL